MPTTLAAALQAYLDEIQQSRATTTWRTYRYVIGKFQRLLERRGYVLHETPLTALQAEWTQWFLDDQRHLAPTTERGYLPVILGFCEYIVAKKWHPDLNLTEVRYYLKRRQRKLPKRARRLPSEQIDSLLTLLDQRSKRPFEQERERLATLRDRALFHLLADSGLRISEACSRVRGDVAWRDQTLFVVGKGNQEALVRLSKRTISRLQRYLEVRQPLDGQQGVASLSKLPLFARHDKKAGKHIKPMSPRAVQKNLETWVKELPEEVEPASITPHTFRHYFVTTVLRKTGGDVEIAQRLARHASINTTMRYAHLNDEDLDATYDEIFN